MGKIDYALKADVLNNHQDILKTVRHELRVYDKLLYAPDKITDEELAAAEKTGGLLYSNPDTRPYYCESKKIIKAERNRRHKLKSKIDEMLRLGPCLFLTLTFTDECLNNTTPETRRTYVRKYLELCSSSFVANKDFGGKNGREHYHAVVLADKVDYSPWHKNGGVKGERVRKIEDASRLARYVGKLTNHAIKETAARSALIYSRPVQGDVFLRLTDKEVEELPF